MMILTTWRTLLSMASEGSPFLLFFSLSFSEKSVFSFFLVPFFEESEMRNS